MKPSLPALLADVRACTHCAGHLPLGPRPARLRAWMGVTREQFYDPRQIAILPMGFWLRRHPWFEADVLPASRAPVADKLAA
jgi:hypothetical protein